MFRGYSVDIFPGDSSCRRRWRLEGDRFDALHAHPSGVAEIFESLPQVLLITPVFRTRPRTDFDEAAMTSDSGVVLLEGITRKIKLQFTASLHQPRFEGRVDMLDFS